MKECPLERRIQRQPERRLAARGPERRQRWRGEDRRIGQRLRAGAAVCRVAARCVVSRSGSAARPAAGKAHEEEELPGQRGEKAPGPKIVAASQVLSEETFPEKARMRQLRASQQPGSEGQAHPARADHEPGPGAPEPRPPRAAAPRPSSSAWPRGRGGRPLIEERTQDERIVIWPDPIDAQHPPSPAKVVGQVEVFEPMAEVRRLLNISGRGFGRGPRSINRLLTLGAANHSGRWLGRDLAAAVAAPHAFVPAPRRSLRRRDRIASGSAVSL
jgi:hypothetical protein